MSTVEKHRREETSEKRGKHELKQERPGALRAKRLRAETRKLAEPETELSFGERTALQQSNVAAEVSEKGKEVVNALSPERVRRR